MATANYIAIWLSVLILMAAAFSSATSTATTELDRAIEEMQKANYFTFVVLLNLAPPELIQDNITFLMPNDKTLSGNTFTNQSSIPDLLLLHSIPSPLLFAHLQHFPSGSILPTSKPGFFLNITNGGTRNLFLNNVRITSPNICTSRTSIRCHGIDGIIQPFQFPPSPGSNIPPPRPTPPGDHPGTEPLPPPPPPPPEFQPPPTTPSPSAIITTPPPPPPNSTRPHKSGSQSQLMMKCDFALMKTLATCLMLFAHLALKL